MCKIRLLQADKKVQETPRKVGGVNRPVPRHMTTKKNHRFCCFGPRPISPENEDRIEHAFRKMDPNNTGYVTWKQFKKVKNFVILNLILDLMMSLQR